MEIRIGFARRIENTVESRGFLRFHPDIGRGRDSLLWLWLIRFIEEKFSYS